jgi:hypothetical protein
MTNLSVHSLCSADRHDVDPVDLFRLVLQTRLDAADQRLDLSTAQAIVDVNPGDDPCTRRIQKGLESP